MRRRPAVRPSGTQHGRSCWSPVKLDRTTSRDTRSSTVSSRKFRIKVEKAAETGDFSGNSNELSPRVYPHYISSSEFLGSRESTILMYFTDPPMHFLGFSTEDRTVSTPPTTTTTTTTPTTSCSLPFIFLFICSGTEPSTDGGRNLPSPRNSERGE